MATTLKIKKGDTVQMLAGKDRGKQGRILEARPRDGKVVVENLNLQTKHQKPRPIRDANRMGGTQIAPGRAHRAADGGVGLERDARLPDVQAADAGRLRLPRHEGRAREGARLQARRLRPGDRQVMATVDRRDLRAAPQAALQRRAPRSAPGAARPLVDHAGRRRISKITLNMGVGEGKTDAKQIDAALEELTIIAGQRAQVRRARKSIAQFKIRDGMPIGVKVTLRGDRMWEFLDRLVSIALPRIRDFRGLSPRLVRRARQLLARHPRADHLPRDRLRQHQPGSRPRRRDHDDCGGRRAGARAPHGARPAVRSRRKREMS